MPRASTGSSGGLSWSQRIVRGSHFARARMLRESMRLPDAALEKLAGPAAEVDGHPLELRSRFLARLAHRMAPHPPKEAEIESARFELEALSVILGGDVPSSVRVEDVRAAGRNGPIPIRVYRPKSGPAPVIVYFHGGGWVFGGIASHEPLCAQLAHDADCVVASVEYRLAPEHRFPAAADDALDAYRWCRQHATDIGGRPSRVCVAGDSAGGNLAAVVCQACPAHDTVQPWAQLLLYPATDFSRDHESVLTYAQGYYLTRERMHWFRDHYLPTEALRTDPRGSPLLAETLADLAPALVMTAGYDPLRDEGQAYAHGLERAGVPVVRRHYEGLLHGFLNTIGALPAAADAYRDLVDATRGLIGRE